MKKKAIICAIITVLCIVATVSLRLIVDNAEVNYTEVKATVLTSETKTKKVLGKRQTYYEVMVSYEGQKYELLNTHGTSSYQPGREVTGFLSDGKLYANIEGVKTSTPLATAYFVFLFLSFGMVIVTVTFISKARQE